MRHANGPHPLEILSHKAEAATAEMSATLQRTSRTLYVKEAADFATALVSVHDGRIVAYGWCFIHSTDIGGRVPSSISPSNHEIFQEGLLLPAAEDRQDKVSSTRT